MTNNELSRKVLASLVAHGGTVRFRALVEELEEDAKVVFKNLFFLEERSYVSLATSYPIDAVYPQIHIVRLRDEGKNLTLDDELMDAAFPLWDGDADDGQDSPELNHGKPVTFTVALELLAVRVRESIDDEDQRDAMLNKIEALLALPIADDPIAQK